MKMADTIAMVAEFILPERNETDGRIRAYLEGRGIDKEIIQACIQRGILYESLPYHNLVYIGYDMKGIPRFAEYQSIYREDIRGTIKGSDRRFGFKMKGISEAGSGFKEGLHVFETPLDLLSYATLVKMGGQMWEKLNLLALTGIFKSKYNGRMMMPLALKEYLYAYPEVYNIYLHFEESRRGHEAANATEQALAQVKVQNYGVLKVGMQDVRTVNEYLLMMLKQKTRAEVER